MLKRRVVEYIEYGGQELIEIEGDRMIVGAIDLSQRQGLALLAGLLSWAIDRELVDSQLKVEDAQYHLDLHLSDSLAESPF